MNLKTILIGTSLICLKISIAMGQTGVKKNDAEFDGFKGKVKKVSQTEYVGKDKFGEIVEDTKTGSVTYKFDDKFNLAEKTWYYSDGSISKKFSYKHDNTGKVTEESGYNSNGDLVIKFIYKYDTKGYISEQNWYNGNGTLITKYIWKYDEKGNQIEENRYDSDGSLSFKYLNKFDSKGNKIEANGYNSQGTLEYKFTYSYQFDTQGNWTKQIEFQNTFPTFITKRMIEYY
jgi:hypothetical protein